MARPPNQETLRTGADERAGTDEAASGHLFVVFQADAPLAAPTRHALDEVDRVVLGRGDARGASRRIEEGERVLDIYVADARMSSRHVALVRDAEGWTAHDLDSRNGTKIGGVTRSGGRLRDGDWIEIGRTHLRFRSSIAFSSSDARADRGEHAASTPLTADASAGFATILPSRERDLDIVRKLAPSRVPLVIEAESGAGKELMARSIHASSGRTGPLVAVNCGAIAPNLLESELFGYRKGAFSGATEDRAGLVRSADKGTLLLDEIADLSPAAQTAMLRVLQENEVVPVGSVHPIPIDVRFLAACQRPLRERVDAGALRPDLLARLAGFTVRVAPLRERMEDFGLIVAALLLRLAPEDAGRITFTSAAAASLLGYTWPLNVRELERALEAAVVLAGPEGRIELEHLPEGLRAARVEVPSITPAPPPEVPAPGAPAAAGVRLSRREGTRQRQLETLLREHEGNVSAVARVTGKARAQIYRWLRRYGLDAQEFVR